MGLVRSLCDLEFHKFELVGCLVGDVIALFANSLLKNYVVKYINYTFLKICLAGLEGNTPRCVIKF